MTTIFSLILGLVMLLVGANYLVESSVALARRAGLSNFIIGLTIVGMGTSAPELLVSMQSAIGGHGDMSVGNVIGSCICNILLVLGATAAIHPFAIESRTLRRDIPIGLMATILLVVLIFSGYIFGKPVMGIDRIDAAVLLTFMAAYMFIVFRKGDADTDEPAEETRLMKRSVWFLIGLAIGSLWILISGSSLLVESASTLALQVGISESVVAITVVAVGTSLPELVTCIVAAFKGNVQLALGNAIGSNIFNIAFVLGTSAMCHPIAFENISILDCIMMIVSALLTVVVAFTFGRNRFDRIEGILFLLLYFAYTAYIVVS